MIMSFIMRYNGGRVSAMKFDKDLARDILLTLEADESDPLEWVEIEIPGHSHQETVYHIQLLAEAGFIEARDLSSSLIYDWKPSRLTYQGHELLDTLRDGEIWKLTKESAKKTGVVSLQALFEIGKAFARQKLIEHGIHLA